jgi:hypothetical protein
MAMDYKNRLAEKPINVDAIRDSAYADFPGSGTGAVSVFHLQDANGNEVMILINITTSAINPNADTTYDAAPINSLLLDGAGATVYIKSTALAWTEVT